MGNHTAGDLINKFATEFSAKRSDKETAIDVLDRAVAAAKSISGFTPDAEFEASDPTDPTRVHPILASWRDPHPLSPLGMLMVEAFAPNGLRDLSRYWPMIEGETAQQAAEEIACDAWWDEVNEPFRQRYGLC